MNDIAHVATASKLTLRRLGGEYHPHPTFMARGPMNEKKKVSEKYSID